MIYENFIQLQYILVDLGFIISLRIHTQYDHYGIRMYHDASELQAKIQCGI